MNRSDHHAGALLGWPLDCAAHCEPEGRNVERCLGGESAFATVSGCEEAWLAEQPDDPSAGCQSGSTCDDVRDGGDPVEQGGAACAAAAAYCTGG